MIITLTSQRKRGKGQLSPLSKEHKRKGVELKFQPRPPGYRGLPLAKGRGGLRTEPDPWVRLFSHMVVLFIYLFFIELAVSTKGQEVLMKISLLVSRTRMQL